MLEARALDRLSNKVAVITGAAVGLGRATAIRMAEEGASVAVLDILDAEGLELIEMLRERDLPVAWWRCDVSSETEVQQTMADIVEHFGRIDILVNNAGILRDKSFAKMEMSDWDKVIAVHLTGSAICTRAVWPVMREQGYGRVIMTTSTSGLYGNFGQTNYGAAKMGVAGMMNTLCLEGEKYDIKINCVAPTAATRMTEDLMPKEVLALLEPSEITPAVLFLASDQAPNRRILLAGAGCYATVRLMESEGIYLQEGERTPDAIAAHFEELADMSNAREMHNGGEHVSKILTKAAQAKGIKLG